MRTTLARLLLALALLGGVPAIAQGPADQIVADLKAEGYAVRAVEQTLLGRIRIEAVRDGERREIVVDRATGEILRDYVDDPKGDG